MDRDQCQDAEGYVFEERSCGRRRYVDSIKLRNLRRARADAQKEVERLAAILDGWDANANEYLPYDRHAYHRSYMDARIRLNSIEASITREQWHLMQKSSDYGYIDAHGDRVPFDGDMVTPDEEPGDDARTEAPASDTADETDVDDQCASCECGACHTDCGVLIPAVQVAEMIVSAVTEARRHTLRQIGDYIDAQLEGPDDEACTEEEEED